MPMALKASTAAHRILRAGFFTLSGDGLRFDPKPSAQIFWAGRVTLSGHSTTSHRRVVSGAGYPLRLSPPARTTSTTTVFMPLVSLRLRILAALAIVASLVLTPAAAFADTGGAGQVESGGSVSNTAFDRQGMWVWYVSHSEGGSLGAIVARARAEDIGTVYVKAADGGGSWSQFSRGLVQTLHQSGLDVCAWQFAYGDNPLAEAKVAAAAIAKGADCFVIDAEADYEGKYAAADRYIRALRARIG